VTRIAEPGITLAVTSNSIVPGSAILVILMMEALSSSETLVLTRATLRNIQKMPFFIVTAVKTSNLTSTLVVQTSAVLGLKHKNGKYQTDFFCRKTNNMEESLV
jgi:hypothetical protein